MIFKWSKINTFRNEWVLVLVVVAIGVVGVGFVDELSKKVEEYDDNDDDDDNDDGWIENDVVTMFVMDARRMINITAFCCSKCNEIILILIGRMIGLTERRREIDNNTSNNSIIIIIEESKKCARNFLSISL